MEEKKSIKFNLITGLLIVAIVIIILLCIYIIRLSTKVDTISERTETSSLTEKTTSISDSLSETNTLDNTTETTNKYILPQLNGEFSDIKSITKDYRDNQNVKNFKDFSYDLDSDGTIDKITLKHITNENEDEYYLLEYNGKSIYEHWNGMGSVGIVDIDDTDNYLDIWVYDDGSSDDPMYYFYRKIENQIINMGEFSIERSFMCDGKGKILVAGRELPWVEPQVFNCYYTIENNLFKKHSLDFSYNKDYEYTTRDGFFTTNLENLKKFEQNKSASDNSEDYLITLGEKYNINKLDENTKFKIIEFVKKDIEEYSVTDLKVTLSDGTTGYLIHPYERFYIYD